MGKPRELPFPEGALPQSSNDLGWCVRGLHLKPRDYACSVPSDDLRAERRFHVDVLRSRQQYCVAAVPPNLQGVPTVYLPAWWQSAGQQVCLLICHSCLRTDRKGHEGSGGARTRGGGSEGALPLCSALLCSIFL